MRMNGWRLMVGLVLAMGCLAVPPAGASGGRAAGGEAVRVVWLKPERVPASRRPALTDLLEQAVSGRPLRGFEVRDSRPQVGAVDLTGWTTSGRQAPRVALASAGGTTAASDPAQRRGASLHPARTGQR